MYVPPEKYYIIDCEKDLYPIIDSLFEIEKKLAAIEQKNSISRNLDKIKYILENGYGFTYHNPIGEKYNETRTDLRASIAGCSPENLVVSEVIKPIIRERDEKNQNTTKIVRPGVVVVESQK